MAITPDEKKLLRSALGLGNTDEHGIATRNGVFLTTRSPEFPIWVELVERALAVSYPPGLHDTHYLFVVTSRGFDACRFGWERLNTEVALTIRLYDNMAYYGRETV